MACRGCWECLLKLFNFILTLTGLAIVGYGIYLFVEFSKASDDDNRPAISPVSDGSALIQLGRLVLTAVSLYNDFFDNSPRAWFIYLFIGIGVVLFLISCFGCIGAATRNGCCLSCYSILVALLILVELGCAAFIFFDINWKEEIPTDKTGEFDAIYGFLIENWNTMKWVALGIVIFEALLFLLALIVRAANRPADYDSDEEFINPRKQVQQPLFNRPPVGPATGIPVAGTIDQRLSRNDAWSTRMREKFLLLSSACRFSPPQGVKLSYGTAGFRADASLLQSTIYRVGILAALKSLKTRSVIGLMITASHNKVFDNGVKIADPSGGMLSQHWEPFADSLANAPSPQHLLLLINEFVEKEGISVDGDWQVEVLLGRDTRPSGDALLQAAKQGVTSIVGAVATDMGIFTTPQLHWMVRARNKGMKASEQDYFEQLSSSFRCLVDLIPTEKSNFDGQVVVDGANGVGGVKLKDLGKLLNGLVIEVRNSSEDEGILNDGVGADYVQKEKVVPHGFGSKDSGIRCASLDGDGDRLVYFIVQPESSGRIDLVDGDKILSLFSVFIREQLTFLNEKEDVKNCHQARLGVVQTAYANGASTNYLKHLGLEVNLAPTGVKYLHEKAAEFDIGIYFEANGHGTVLFSESFIGSLEARTNEISSGSKGSDGEKAALRLLAVSKLINQAVGDALSGLLLVEVILQHMGWSINKWNELYHDLPSRQLKVKVPDRTVVVTTNAETVVVNPPGLQEAINEETAKYPQGRCFVRPSGTEDVVRVYAEASTQEAADTLANSVAKLVDQFLGSNRS